MNTSELKYLLNKIYNDDLPELNDLITILKINDSYLLQILFEFANDIKKKFFNNEILIRGVIEFSNYCSKDCFYCGLNKNNQSLKRYILSDTEILNTTNLLFEKKIKTVVLQSGEIYSFNSDWLANIIREIKKNFDIAITLSVGEKKYEDYKKWRITGADRYLLKIETTNQKLYDKLHTISNYMNRLNCLQYLKELNYQTGSGNIIGLPEQTIESIANDILFFKKENFDMIAIGPFIPHPLTKLANKKKGDILLTLKTIALTRIVTKNAHIPATTALSTFDKDYRADAINCGANVIMIKCTPAPYNNYYEIYKSDKRKMLSIEEKIAEVEKIAEETGNEISFKKGDSLKKESELYVSHTS
ncbi:MAG TPA: [FeFe] hydrogenase H-cluster radical SAM maturase HydE [bacterium]|nr:[FeFe] hydrogenase H-cluster radical SAM maturase HydE [bacterium]HOL47555.1 [FeFe] hydrogenase H-cluster radical SAM maturase HydE [bacterium]HPQ18448.1 [FeFe] hydrogenase H-cluster radical SAM maturase HydE [bacterium]